MKVIFFLSVALLAFGACATNQWTPTENMDPSAVLAEARTDRESGRYSIALQKHVWYFESALTRNSSLYGVRLSFALEEWKELASLYPPAMSRLKQIRDDSERSIKLKESGYASFVDFAALNRVLSTNERTVELFKWLDDEAPTLARDSYLSAQDALVEAGEFELCGKYVEADAFYESHLRLFRLRQDRAAKTLDQSLASERASQIFAYDVAILVAILAKTGRTDEASNISNNALAYLDQDSLKRQVLEAKGGNVPVRIY